MFSFYIYKVIWFAPKKRTSGSCENYFFDPVPGLPDKALKYRRVFRIDGNNRHPVFNSFLYHDITGNHQGFFICQCNCLTVTKCF